MRYCIYMSPKSSFELFHRNSALNQNLFQSFAEKVCRFYLPFNLEQAWFLTGAIFSTKDNIRDKGSSALWTVFTAYIAYIAFAAHTAYVASTAHSVYTFYTVETALEQKGYYAYYIWYGKKRECSGWSEPDTP